MATKNGSFSLSRIAGLAKILAKSQRGRLKHVTDVKREFKQLEESLKTIVGFGKLTTAELQKCVDHEIPSQLVDLVAWLLPLAYQDPSNPESQKGTCPSKQALSLWKWATSLLNRFSYDLAEASSYQQRDRDLLTQLQPTSDDAHPGTFLHSPTLKHLLASHLVRSSTQGLHDSSLCAFLLEHIPGSPMHGDLDMVFSQLNPNLNAKEIHQQLEALDALYSRQCTPQHTTALPALARVAFPEHLQSNSYSWPLQVMQHELAWLTAPSSWALPPQRACFGTCVGGMSYRTLPYWYFDKTRSYSLLLLPLSFLAWGCCIAGLPPFCSMHLPSTLPTLTQLHCSHLIIFPPRQACQLSAKHPIGIMHTPCTPSALSPSTCRLPASDPRHAPAATAALSEP